MPRSSSHSNIVHVFDFGQLEGRYFIAMEYVPGVTLRIAHKRMVARGERLPVTTVLHVMMDVCDALEHVHAAADGRGALGLVHRDISPDNVIISTSGSAKLIDFGAARATARTPPTPVFVGKYRYAAPERIRKAGEDCRSDVYSAGVILYECLAGKRPFDGTDAEVIEAVLAGSGCDPRARVPTIPARLAEVVVKATAQNPADRFASARELRAALAVCLEESGGASKERDVTAALADLLETPAPETAVSFASAPDAEAVPRADRRRRRRRADVVGRRDRAVRGGDPRSVGADPQARRAPAAARAGRAAGAGAAEAVARQSAARAGAARRGAAISAGLDLLGAARRRERRSAAGGRRRRRDRPRSNAPRASAPSRCSIAGWSCGAAAATARRSTRGRRRWRSRPTTASTRRTCSGCGWSSAGCAPRRPRSTSRARCASRARRWAPRRASASTACSAWWRSTR